jgi:hypothetical protein
MNDEVMEGRGRPRTLPPQLREWMHVEHGFIFFCFKLQISTKTGCLRFGNSKIGKTD